MSAAEIEERVRRVIADELGLDEDQVTFNAHMRDDLEADELDRVEVEMALEEEFGVAFADDMDSDDFRVRDLCRLVGELLSAKTPA